VEDCPAVDQSSISSVFSNARKRKMQALHPFEEPALDAKNYEVPAGDLVKL
jgi:hypothetical protein